MAYGGGGCGAHHVVRDLFLATESVIQLAAWCLLCTPYMYKLFTDWAPGHVTIGRQSWLGAEPEVAGGK